MNIAHREVKFEFTPPTLLELYGIIVNIDVNISSCVQGIYAKTYKNLLEIMPVRFLKIFGNSLFLGVFPEKWACSTLTFLPKDGDKYNPNNWRPISQTNIFSKILEKCVHIRMIVKISSGEQPHIEVSICFFT